MKLERERTRIAQYFNGDNDNWYRRDSGYWMSEYSLPTRWYICNDVWGTVWDECDTDESEALEEAYTSLSFTESL